MLHVSIFRLPSDAKLAADIQDAVSRVFASRQVILGPEVTAFEQEFAAYCGTSHCIGVANGTDALELALRAVGVNVGDRVLLAANAGFYGSTAVHACGAKPIYADIDPVTRGLSLASLQQIAGEAKPAAIIVTHLYGHLADIENIVVWANEWDIPVIEDCAQAHGARRDGQLAGSFGTVGCFSFYPTKNLGALGDGGAVVTHDSTIADHLRQLRQYGWGQKYRVNIPGGRNSRLDEIQAAILRVKLGYLDEWNAERRRIATRYNKAFVGLLLELPQWQDEDYVAHLYVVRVADRQGFRTFLADRGVGTDVHYPIPDYAQPAYETGGDTLVETEAACCEVVSLPCFPGMTEDEIAVVISAVQAWGETCSL